MSISNETLRIQNAKSNLKRSIQNKDVTVPSSTKIDGYPPLVDSIGESSDPDDAVRFFDYDGTILHEYSAAEFLALTQMPANPSHTGLVAQGWNWSLADAQEYVAEWGYQDIGQMYITQSGDTEIDVEFPTGFKRLSPYLRIAVNGTVEVDWGDGSSVDTLTGASLTTAIDTQHTYASTGNYTIVIHVVSGGFAFYTNNMSYSLLHNNQSTSEKNRIYSSRVTAIRIGSGCKLETYCLSYLFNLLYITIPNSILGSGTNGFQYCYSLNCLIIPNNMTAVSFSCQNSYGLSVISLPKNLTSCSPNFNNCYSLDRLIYPPNVTTTVNFYNSVSATSRDIIVPYNNYKRIFKGENFEYLLEEKTSIPANYFSYNILLKKIAIPSNILQTGSSAFNGCYCLKTVELPINLEEITNNSFYNCYSLKNINIPTNIKRINTGAFQECRSIKTLYIPDGVTLNGTTFYGMSALKSLRLPSDLTTYGVIYFSGSNSLSSIEIPNGVTQIPSSAFSSCSSLSTLSIPSGVTSIGNQAFNYCYSLSSLTIPSGVTSIGSQVFAYCYGMKEYHFLPTTPPTLANTNAFSGIPSDCIIYVPSASLDAYKTASNWSTYASYMQGE